MASKRRNMFHKNKTQETTEKVTNEQYGGWTTRKILTSLNTDKLRKRLLVHSTEVLFFRSLLLESKNYIPLKRVTIFVLIPRKVCRNKMASGIRVNVAILSGGVIGGAPVESRLPRPESVRRAESSGVDRVLTKGGSDDLLPTLEAWTLSVGRRQHIDVNPRVSSKHRMLVPPEDASTVTTKLVAEFPPCGGVLTDSDFSTLQLLRYLNWWDILMLPFEICFMLMVFGFTILFFVRVCCLEKLRTPFKWWHFVELSILFASYVTIGTSLYLMLIVDDRLKLAYEALEMDKHYSFEHLVKIQWITNISVGFLVFFVMIKFLKFMPLTGVVGDCEIQETVQD
ncbi:hypothetical protein AAG570_003899 [Ranatra chinensis]|uniref:Polycystin cation channel PKD1/PKD2 domain-containing protein n=1 Tax=Ranatra chinensis TaxID=642074 RepID=A0ABD0YP12_9HEMI